MNVLVIGASGFLGRKVFSVFKKAGYNVKGTSFSKKSEFIKLDITSKSDVIELFKKFKPEVVINCAAITDVDWCESHRKECFEINADAVRNLAEACKDSDAKMIQISTSFVFDGTKTDEYDEAELVSPINIYSESKVQGEKYVQSLLEDYLILRTIVFYGLNNKDDKSTFVKWVIEKLKNNTEVRVVSDQYVNPTLIDDIANAMLSLVKLNQHGIFNVNGSNSLSKYEFALQVADCFGYDKKLILPITSESLNQTAKRPMILRIDVSKLRNLGIETKNTIDGLKEMKRQMSFQKPNPL